MPPERTARDALPERADCSGWYWLHAPMQSAPVVGFYCSGLHTADGVARWRVGRCEWTVEEFELRGWRLGGRCLTAAEVERLCAAAYESGRAAGREERD